MEGGGNENIVREYLEKRQEKQENQIHKIEASVFQVANYNFVFQGVILTAVIKGSGSSSGLQCSHFWLPFILSLIGSFLNFGTLLILTSKYKQGLDQLDNRRLALYKHTYVCPGSTDDPARRNAIEAFRNKNKQAKMSRQIFVVISLFSFLVFALLNLVAARLIPC